MAVETPAVLPSTVVGTEAGTPAATKAERTREALRQAAVRHFLEHGFEAASVPTIAAEVGVTERTFYRHFATKDEVLFVDVSASLAWFRTSLRERLDAGDDLLSAILDAITSPPFDARPMLEIARLRVRLLSPARIERSFREAQGVLARDIRTVLAEQGDDRLGGAVRSEAAAGAVFAALAIWTESGSTSLRQLLASTHEALDEIRPILRTAGIG